LELPESGTGWFFLGNSSGDTFNIDLKGDMSFSGNDAWLYNNFNFTDTTKDQTIQLAWVTGNIRNGTWTVDKGAYSANFTSGFGAYGGAASHFVINSGTVNLQNRNFYISPTGSFTQSGGTFTGAGNGWLGAFTQSAGVFNAPAGNLYISGDFSRTGGTFNHNSGNVGFDRSGTQAITSGGGTFYDVQILGGSVCSLQDALDVDGNLTISNALNANGNNINVAGDWLNSGTFDHGSATVTFDGGGDSAITGSNTFNNLTSSAASKQSLTFGVGETQTIEGTLSLNGTDESNLLILQSSTPGQEWFIVNPSEDYTMEFLDVRDSTNTGTLFIAPGSELTNCTGWATAPPSPPSPGGVSGTEEDIQRATYATDRFSNIDQQVGEEVLDIPPIGIGGLMVMSVESTDIINVPAERIGTGAFRIFSVEDGEFIYRIRS
jgi:hypothetical protein